MKNKNGLRERDFYKITDKMWKEIEKWSEGHNVELKFNWTFAPIATFLEVIDDNTKAHIDFCDGDVQTKIDIPKENDSVELRFQFKEHVTTPMELIVSCYKENVDYVTNLLKDEIKNINRIDFVSELASSIKNDPKVIKVDDDGYNDEYKVTCLDERLIEKK
jgi:translation elongation factor EF-G